MSDLVAYLRSEVMALPAADRLDYALELLDFYLNPTPNFYEGCYALGLGFTARDVRLIHALDCRRGSFLSLEAMQSALEVDRRVDEWPSRASVTKRLSGVVNTFKRSRFPVAFQNWYGVGTKLIAPPEFRFEEMAVTHVAR